MHRAMTATLLASQIGISVSSDSLPKMCRIVCRGCTLVPTRGRGPDHARRAGPHHLLAASVRARCVDNVDTEVQGGVEGADGLRVVDRLEPARRSPSPRTRERSGSPRWPETRDTAWALRSSSMYRQRSSTSREEHERDTQIIMQSFS